MRSRVPPEPARTRVSVPVHQGHRRAVGPSGRGIWSTLYRRRHDAGRPDARDSGAAGRPCRHQCTALHVGRPHTGESACWRTGADVGAGGSLRRPTTSSNDRSGVGAQRVGATAQHGVNRRQPDAASEVLVLPRCLGGVQPAHPRHRVRGDRGPQSHTRDSRYQRTVRRHPPVGPRGSPRGSGRGRRRPGPRRRKANSVVGLLPTAG